MDSSNRSVMLVFALLWGGGKQEVSSRVPSNANREEFFFLFYDITNTSAMLLLPFTPMLSMPQSHQCCFKLVRNKCLSDAVTDQMWSKLLWFCIEAWVDWSALLIKAEWENAGFYSMSVIVIFLLHFLTIKFWLLYTGVKLSIKAAWKGKANAENLQDYSAVYREWLQFNKSKIAKW